MSNCSPDGTFDFSKKETERRAGARKEEKKIEEKNRGKEEKKNVSTRRFLFERQSVIMKAFYRWWRKVHAPRLDATAQKY